jgi:hypothetical protein
MRALPDRDIACVQEVYIDWKSPGGVVTRYPATLGKIKAGHVVRSPSVLCTTHRLMAPANHLHE